MSDLLTQYHNQQHSKHDMQVIELLVRYSQALPKLPIHQRVKFLEKIRLLINDENSLLALQLLCEISGVDYKRFIAGRIATIRTDLPKFPRLVCHMLCMLGSCFSNTYMAKVLQLDEFEAQQLIDHLKHTFTIDDPMRWLQGLALEYAKKRMAPIQNKTELLIGKDPVNQPVDTREERRLKNRILRSLSPYIDRYS